jgi:hypothetical protein
MANSSTIYCIHSSDAPQHSGELKAILLRMKLDNRISDFVALDISVNTLSPSIINEKTTGIIILLTHGTEQIRTEIERLLPVKHDIKLIEIIVDNLPYNNSFISFPQDLKPIRSRDDMNLVWKNIEYDLREIFRKPSIVVAPTADNKKYLKLAGISIAALILGNLLILAVFPHVAQNNKIALSIFIAFLPFIIYAIHRKSLELVTLPSPEPKRISGAINWKQLIRRTAVAFVVLFVSFYLWAFALILTGILGALSLAPSIMGGLTTLLFLSYKSGKKKFSSIEVEQTKPSP